MLLAIDIGNTLITAGLWDGQEWRLQWRLRTIHDQTVDEYGIYLKMLLREVDLADAVDQVIFSSVVPPLTRTFDAVCHRYLNLTPLQVTAETDTGIRVTTERPSEVGADRIVNAAAAYHLYPGASIIVDMGTATTLDVVSEDGALLGVIIVPGLEVAADALAGRAAQLSRVALEAPPQVLGRNTTHAMQSGLIFGYTSLVEGLVQRLRNELDLPHAPVIATGGLINVISEHTDVVDHLEPWLTLTGLRLISQRARR
ncbi:MAG TPA: type III pantothenate kinase [Candidatus Sulfomarinibacteraceae bacterium]|nr:type III pantothenate kinase [Candidatus Sulfomarinibacteraceae bacterium]